MSRRDELLALGSQDLGALVEHTLGLEARVDELSGRLAQDSHNSGRPPASDGMGKKPTPKSLRTKTGRKPGGQNGHLGRTLQPVDKPDTTVPHLLGKCPCGHCGGISLAQVPVAGYECRQVLDLPPLRLHVTEHQAEIKVCPVSGQEVRASFPPEVIAPVQYGSNFQGFISYLNIAQFIPTDRVARVCEDLFGQTLSVATVLRSNQRIYENLAGFENVVTGLLRQSPVLHVDESGLRVGGRLHWIHVTCTSEITFYGVHPKRGTVAMDALGILPGYEGWLIHDHLAAYFRYPSLHGLCNEHIRRELKYLAEEEGHRWAADLSAFLWKTHQRAQRCGGFSHRQYQRVLNRYHRILRRGRRAHTMSDKAANLLARLAGFDCCVLAHLIHPEVPFTNNQAEQDIRMIKVRQKISGCFRTLHGAQVFVRIRGYLSTCRKQGKNLLEALKQAVLGQPFLPEPKAASP